MDHLKVDKSGAAESPTLARVTAPEPTRRGLGREHMPFVAGAVASLVVAVLLFTRFGINGNLSRDESIYAYGGQQFAHGVPPYASIFDVKGPLASMIPGLAVAFAHLIGRNELYLIRVTFFVCACLTVLAIYLLAARLWRSVVAGVVAAVVFASFTGFAEDALSGPDAKTPGILFAVVSMWFACRKQWFWAAFVGSLAFLVWQPLAIYPVIAVAVAALNSPQGRRWRSTGLAFAGLAIPNVAAVIYFAAVGALGKFFESAFVFPVTGLQQGHQTVPQRIRHIASVVHTFYRFSGLLLAIGTAVLVLLVAMQLIEGRRDLRAAVHDPLVCVIFPTLLVQVGFAATDFQGYPDVYPLLPYGALGLGGLAAVLIGLVRSSSARPVAVVAPLVAVAVLAGFSWVWFTDAPASGNHLRVQLANACALNRTVVPGHPLYVLGDPTPLVLTRWRNPDRFIYLASGVDQWKIKHTAGGFEGWTRQISAAHPSVVLVGGWYTTTKRRMVHWLEHAGYHSGYMGGWRVFLTPAARAHAVDADVHVTKSPTHGARSLDGRLLPEKCA